MAVAKILISGASIAGPALAGWLGRNGFDVTVVEKAPEIRPGGQAVDFKGRTHHDVLTRMGILDDVRAEQTTKTDWRMVDADDKVTPSSRASSSAATWRSCAATSPAFCTGTQSRTPSTCSATRLPG